MGLEGCVCFYFCVYSEKVCKYVRVNVEIIVKRGKWGGTVKAVDRGHYWKLQRVC